MLSLAVNLFVCVVLMVKFNPFIKVAFTANDTRFIFACSTVLFSNILATNYLVKPYYVRSATPSSKKPKKRSPQRRRIKTKHVGENEHVAVKGNLVPN
jgi:hypothetical protein